MKEYSSKQELINEIKKYATVFISEFDMVNDHTKDLLLEGVDRTPSQMIAYQLGWMNLLLYWESEEQKGNVVVTPSAEYKWNNLGGLYKSFYKAYEGYSISELINSFNDYVNQVVTLVESYSDEELFNPGGREWSSSTPANWPIYKWVHINTVAPFKSFRTKIRKWNKVKRE